MEKEEFVLKQPHGLNEIDTTAVLEKYMKDKSAVNQYVYSITEDKYLFWDKAQFKDPAKGFTKIESWYLAREIRKISSYNTPIKNSAGENFTWLRLKYTDELLRYIDMYAGGNFLRESDSNKSTNQQKYLARGILEEAIASSQLEGADTTRRYAKKMIAEKIAPRNSSDWMILNNFNALQKIENEFKNRPLSREMLLEIQSELTQNTHKEPINRFREDKDEIIIEYNGKIVHTPPNQEILHKELDRLIEYANDESSFTHPVIKAITLHFWIAYLHPFVDGNGRTARAIFYWHMLRNDYWAFAYLPISTVIKRSPGQYANAYIYAEQDNLDFTYFYDYHMKKIIQTIDEFKEFISKTSRENAYISRKVSNIVSLNDRQKQIVLHLLDSAENYVNIASHQKLQGVSRQTAHRDISELAQQDLLVSEKVGQVIRYSASDKLRKITQGED